MVKIMLCGSREAADIRMLAQEGVDAVGLITEVKQEIPCRLSLEESRRLCSLIPSPVLGVLILTEERVAEICRMVETVLPDAVQLHGFNTPEDVAELRRRLKIKIIKTIHFRDGKMANREGSPEEAALEYLRAGADAILLDTCDERRYGSTGRVFPWDTARRIREAVHPAPVILAGGLHAGNVAEACRQVRPYGVDAFTAVTAEGKLERAKVREFVGAVRRGVLADDAG